MMISALTSEVQEALDRVEQARAAKLVELRFRRGQAVRMVFPWGEELLTRHGSPIPVTEQLLGEMVDRATGFSPYACKLEETGLYLPLEGGCRMGLCGETVIRDGKIWGIRNLSSAVVRIARERKGAAQSVMDTLLAGNRPHSALILSPPGEGKTTFLRDLIRHGCCLCTGSSGIFKHMHLIKMHFFQILFRNIKLFFRLTREAYDHICSNGRTFKMLTEDLTPP